MSETFDLIKPSFLSLSNEKKLFLNSLSSGGMTVTQGGNYLLVYPSSGAAGEHAVYYASLVESLKSGKIGKLNLIPIVPSFEAEYEVRTSSKANKSILLFRILQTCSIFWFNYST